MSGCYPSDNGDPVLGGLSVDHTSVDVHHRSRVVAVRVRITDSGGPGAATGIGSVDVTASNARRSAGVTQRLHDTGGGVWMGSLRIPRKAAPGIWQIAIKAGDKVGNYHDWRSEDLAQLGQTSHLTVLSRLDRRAPVVTAFEVSRHRVNALSIGRRVEITAEVRDQGSGVARVTGSLTQRAHSNYRDTAYFTLHRVAGSARSGRWRGDVVIPAWAPAGRWDPAIDLADHVGQERAYSRTYPAGTPAAGHRLKLSPVRVRSAIDEDYPVVLDLSLSAAAVDIRPGTQDVTVTVHATDATSGLEVVYANIVRNSTRINTPIALRLVAGTRKDGTWTGVLQADPCRMSAGTYTVLGFARDQYGHVLSNILGDTSSPTRELVVTGYDRDIAVLDGLSGTPTGSTPGSPRTWLASEVTAHSWSTWAASATPGRGPRSLVPGDA